MYDRPDCCVDEHFTDKARIIGGTTAGFNKSMGLKAALRSWAIAFQFDKHGHRAAAVFGAAQLPVAVLC